MDEASTPDTAVGARMAEIRRQRDLTQDEFLELMHASGVTWTRTTLSRIEGGQRALKAAELFVAAEVLGVSSDEFNPRNDPFVYASERQRARLRSAQIRARESAFSVDDEETALNSLMLANELRSGRTSFVVHGNPVQFLRGLSRALGGVLDLSEVRQHIGIPNSEYVRALGGREHQSYPLGDRVEFLAKADNDVYGNLFRSVFPDLKFVDSETNSLTVDGLDAEG